MGYLSRARALFDVDKNWWLLIVPSFFFIFFIFIFPILHGVYISTQKWMIGVPEIQFIGLGNYFKIFQDNLFWQSLKVTFIYSFSTLALTILISLIAALALNEEIKGTNVFSAFVLIPWAISPLVTGVIWNWMLNGYYGVINYTITSLGLLDSYVNFLTTDFAMFWLVLATAWSYSPMMTFILLSGLKGIPTVLYEAAEVDGSNALQRFRMITLPLLRNALLVAITFVMMWSLRAFDLIYSLTSGGPGYSTTVLGWIIYLTTFTYLDFGKGAAQAIVLAAITIIICYLFFKSLYRRIEY